MVKPFRNWFNHCAFAVAAVVSIGAISGCVSSRSQAKNVPGTPLEKKLAEDPNDPQTNFALAEAAEHVGDWLRAEQYYLRAEALGIPPEKIVQRIVRVLVAAQRYDEALDRCRHRLALAPSDRATRFVEAALYQALDRTMDAERELNLLVRTDAKDPQAWLALGRLYRDGYNDRARARQMFEKYLELAPSGDQAASVRFELQEEPNALPPVLPPPTKKEEGAP